MHQRLAIGSITNRLTIDDLFFIRKMRYMIPDESFRNSGWLAQCDANLAKPRLLC
jgi:hypothetical protein